MPSIIISHTTWSINVIRKVSVQSIDSDEDLCADDQPAQIFQSYDFYVIFVFRLSVFGISTGGTYIT